MLRLFYYGTRNNQSGGSRMKRMSLLLAGTAIPLALLLAPDVSAR